MCITWCRKKNWRSTGAIQTESDKFMLLVHGVKDEIGRTKEILETSEAEEVNTHVAGQQIYRCLLLLASYQELLV